MWKWSMCAPWFSATFLLIENSEQLPSTVMRLKKLEITGRLEAGRDPDGKAWAVRE
jgi:hypothetical protein